MSNEYQWLPGGKITNVHKRHVIPNHIAHISAADVAILVNCLLYMLQFLAHGKQSIARGQSLQTRDECHLFVLVLFGKGRVLSHWLWTFSM